MCDHPAGAGALQHFRHRDTHDGGFSKDGRSKTSAKAFTSGAAHPDACPPAPPRRTWSSIHCLTLLAGRRAQVMEGECYPDAELNRPPLSTAVGLVSVFSWASSNGGMRSGSSLHPSVENDPFTGTAGLSIRASGARHGWRAAETLESIFDRVQATMPGGPGAMFRRIIGTSQRGLLAGLDLA